MTCFLFVGSILSTIVTKLLGKIIHILGTHSLIHNVKNIVCLFDYRLTVSYYYCLLFKLQRVGVSFTHISLK